MSTRSNIIVTGGGLSFTLYRHCDGYPAETGASLIECLKKFIVADGSMYLDPKSATASFAASLLQVTTSHGSFSYEITTEIHGDIEHMYRVKFTNDNRVEIGHCPVDIGSDREDAELLKSLTTYTLADFAAMVNKERSQMNNRGKAMGFTDSYEMVTI